MYTAAYSQYQSSLFFGAQDCIISASFQLLCCSPRFFVTCQAKRNGVSFYSRVLLLPSQVAD